MTQPAEQMPHVISAGQEVGVGPFNSANPYPVVRSIRYLHHAVCGGFEPDQLSIPSVVSLSNKLLFFSALANGQIKTPYANSASGSSNETFGRSSAWSIRP